MLIRKDIQKIIPEADNKVIDVLKIQNSVSSRNSYGGTAPKNVLKAAREAKKRFLKDKLKIFSCWLDASNFIFCLLDATSFTLFFV